MTIVHAIVLCAQLTPDQHWPRTREKILMFSGLAWLAAQFVVVEAGGQFHYEFLLGALALCGVSLTQWGDRRT